MRLQYFMEVERTIESMARSKPRSNSKERRQKKRSDQHVSAPRTNPSGVPMPTPEKSQSEPKKSMWSFITSWPMVAIIGPGLVALGFGVLSMTPAEVKVAIGFFSAGYLLALVKIAWWAAFERPEPIWERAIFLSVVFAATGLLWFVSCAFAETKSPATIDKKQEPFTVDVESSMVQTNPGFTMNRFFVGYRSGLGDTLSPVDVSMFVRLVNLQPFPSTIQELSIEAAFDGKNWQSLFNVPIRGNQIFWIGVPDGATKCREIGTDNALDVLLQDRPIQPHESIRGWLYLTIPRDYHVPANLRETKYRITARDAAGTKFVYTSSPSKSENAGGRLSQSIGIHVLPGYRNVENLQQKYYQVAIGGQQ